MADRIVKPDSGNDLVLQNDDGSAKVFVYEAGTVAITPQVQIDNIKIDGNSITSEDSNGHVNLTPNGTGSVVMSKVDINSGTIDGATIATSDVTVGSGKTLDVNAGTLTTSTAQKQAIVQAGPGSGTLDVSSGTFTTSTAQKQAIVQAGPGSGTFDVSSGTFTTSTAQKQAIIDGATIPGGITMADQWRLNTTLATSNGPITSNLERVDDGWFAQIGTGMTMVNPSNGDALCQASGGSETDTGIFKFPQTGVYLVTVSAHFLSNGGGAHAYGGVHIMITENNADYSNQAEKYTSAANTSYYGSTHNVAQIDVDNTTNIKLKFNRAAASTLFQTLGDTNSNQTTFTFIRLGAT